MTEFSPPFQPTSLVSLQFGECHGGGLVALSEAKSDNGMNIFNSSDTDVKKKRVVVLGTGWTGTSFLKNLKNSSYYVQVISPRNFFAFTPLLPSVTCGKVEAHSIVEPIRNIVRKKNVDIQYWEAECFKIDAENKKVHCQSHLAGDGNAKEEIIVDYDYLVVSIGACANTFNIPGVAENCHFLKVRVSGGPVEEFAKLIVAGACRGDPYVKYPSWYI